MTPLRWTPDGSKVYVGLKEQEQDRTTPAPNAEPQANVDVWHWKDAYIQPVQMVRAQQDRNRTYTAAVLLAEKKVVPLADPRMDRVDSRWCEALALAPPGRENVLDPMGEVPDASLAYDIGRPFQGVDRTEEAPGVVLDVESIALLFQDSNIDIVALLDVYYGRE